MDVFDACPHKLLCISYQRRYAPSVGIDMLLLFLGYKKTQGISYICLKPPRYHFNVGQL